MADASVRTDDATGAPDEPVELTPETFDEFVHSSPVVLIDLYGEGCTPCEELAPKLERIAADRDLAVGKLNTSEYPGVATGERSFKGRLLAKLPGEFDGPVPTLLLYRDGDLLDRKWGDHPEDDIHEWIDETLSA